jgi:hypothetical protein
MSLGSYGEYTVDQARKHLVSIDSGIDLLEASHKDPQGETVKAYVQPISNATQSWTDAPGAMISAALPVTYYLPGNTVRLIYN